MRRLVALAVVVGALCPLLLPGSGAATVFRLEQFEASVTGTATITWSRRDGPVGTSCQGWFSQDGTTTATFRSGATPMVVTLISGAATGTGEGTGTLRGRVRTTEAFATEPGCCPATAAGAARAPGPPAHAADCSQQAQQRVSRDEPCRVSHPQVVLALRGRSAIRATVAVGEVPPPGGLKRCSAAPGWIPDPVLFPRSDLTHLGARGKLIAQRSLKGRCPGVAADHGAGTEKVACRFTLRIKATIHRVA